MQRIRFFSKKLYSRPLWKETIIKRLDKISLNLMFSSWSLPKSCKYLYKLSQQEVHYFMIQYLSKWCGLFQPMRKSPQAPANLRLLQSIAH